MKFRVGFVCLMGFAGSLFSQTVVWEKEDVGTVTLAGSVSGTDAAPTVLGCGTQIDGTADSFYYKYLAVTGNVEILAKFTSQSASNTQASAGLMIRQSLEAGSPHAMVAFRPSNGGIFTSRSTSGGSSSNSTFSTSGSTLWLRLVRSGNTLTGYRSTDDGFTWVQAGQVSVTMSGTIYMGVAVCSHDNAIINTASFASVLPMVSVPQTGSGSTNPKVWFRPDTGITLTSSKVSTWADQSTNGYDVTQTTSGNRPTIASAESAIKNHRPLAFSNSNKTYLQRAYDSSLASTQASIFAVAKRISGSSGVDTVSRYHTGNSTGWRMQYNTGTEPRIFINNNATDSSVTLSSGTWGLINSVSTTSTTKIYVNGSLGDTNNTTSITNNTNQLLYVGGKGTSNNLDGSMAEILVFNTALADADRLAVEAYIYSKYGLGIAQSTTAPTSSPATGTYNDAQYISLSGPAGALIYYTTNGSTPTPGASGTSLYRDPFLITVTTTVKAKAYRFGYADSSVASLVYAIPDTDLDNMADGWEIANGLNPYSAADASQDPDGDGLTNLQEYQQDKDPNDYYNGVAPQISIISGNSQSGLPSAFTTDPLVLKVTNSGGTALVNAPVTFTVVGNGNNLAYANSGTPTLYPTVTLRSNSSGLAKIDSGSVSRDLYVKLPASAGNIQVQVTVPNYPAVTATFTGTAVNPDTDGDGMIDSWEDLHGLNKNSAADASLDPDLDGLSNLQEYQQNSDPQDYYSQGSTTIIPVITKVGGHNQNLSEAGFWTDPLKVEVRNVLTNAILVNAPVTFAVGEGGGKLALSVSGTLLDTLYLVTDSSGQAEAVFKSATPAAYRNTATATTSGQQVTFTDYVLQLAGRWNLNENTGTNAADSTAFAHNATLTNGPTWAAGFDGAPAVDLDGVNDYLTAGNPGDGSLDFGSDSFSISLWVKFTDVSTAPGHYGRRIISKGHHGWNTGYFIGLGVGTGQIGTGIGSTQNGVSAEAIVFKTTASYNDGKWHHVAVLFDRQNAWGRIYVDGTAQTLVNDSAAGGAVSGSDATRVDYPSLQNLSATRSDMALTFSSHVGTYDFFHGGLDDIRLYRGVLTPTEIAAQYNADSDSDSLPDRWEMEQFGNLSQTAVADADGDGLTNLQEYQQGKNPGDYYNGIAPQLAIVGGDSQSGLSGTFSTQPLVVKVWDGTNPLVNAPVSFTVAGGGNNLAYANTGTPQLYNTLGLRTDNSGLAKIDSGSVSRNLYAKYTMGSGNNLQIQASVAGYSQSTATFNLSVIDDADADGIADTWESQHGLNPNSAADASLDPDGDSATNLQEYQAGSDLNDYYSQPDGNGGVKNLVPTVQIVGGNNQVGAPSSFVTQPLSVEVHDGIAGPVLKNAPLLFTVTQGGGKIALFNQGAPALQDSLEIRTDVLTGGCEIYYRQPAGFEVESKISGSAGQGIPALFTVHTMPDSHEPPVLTVPESIQATLGQPLNYQIGVTGYQITFSATQLPAGLNLNASTGVISGTPTQAGNYPVVLHASNAYGSSDAVTTVAVVAGPPVITSTLAVSIAKNEPLEYILQGDYNPQTWNVSGLPAGLSYDSNSGAILGTLAQEGTYSFTLQAVNAYGSDTETVMVTVGVALPQIQSAAQVDATQGQSLSFQIQASNNPLSFSATALPTGLSLNTATGLISGTPAVLGNTLVKIAATNASGTKEAYLKIRVNPLGSPVLDLPEKIYLTKNQSFSYQVQSTGYPSQFQATDLPAGLSINTTTGLISGTPTTVGTPEAEITATNSVDSGQGKLLFVVVSPTRSASAVMKFQEGVSPTPSYQSESAGMAQDTAQATLANAPLTAENIGALQGTQIWRVMLGFGLGELPPDALISSSNLQIYGTARGTVYPSIDLLSVNAAVDWSQITWNTASSLATGSINSATPAGASAAALTFSSNTAFVNKASDVFASTDKQLKLLLKATAAESIAANLRPRSFDFSDNYVNTPSQRPKLELGYTTGAPPEMVLPEEWVIQQGVAVVPLEVYATHAPSSFSVTGLPSGLAMDGNTGTLSGTPMATGDFTPEITAVNANGNGKRKLKIHVISPPPAITSPLTWTFVAGQQAQYTITANNNPTHFTASNVPSGITLNESTGVLSGTVSGPYAYNMTVKAENEAGSGQATVVVTVQPSTPVINSSLTVSGSLLANFNYTITASQSPTSYSATGLPPGLSLSGSQIQGIPTQVGTYNVQISATNSAGTDTAQLEITIGSAPLPVMQAYTAQATVDTAFNGYLYFTNGPSSTSATGLPPGLNLSGTNISGTPTTAGTYTFTVTASNQYGTANGQGTVVVHPAGPWIEGSTVLEGVEEYPLSLAIYTNSAESMAIAGLPAELTFQTVSNGSSGQITGTPAQAGIFALTATVSNGQGTNQVSLQLTIKPIPIITSMLEVNATAGQSFIYTVTATGDVTELSASGLPQGWTFNSTTGVISGTPQQAGLVSIPIAATNSNGTRSRILKIDVSPNPSDLVAELQAGHLPDNSYQALMANIRNDSANAASLSESLQTDGVYWVGRLSSTEVRRILLGYDLSSLPDDIEITSASLSLQALPESATGVPSLVSVHEAASFLPDDPDWADNSSFQITPLTTLSLDVNSSQGEVAFYSTPAFVAAAQKSVDNYVPLDLTLRAPQAEAAQIETSFGFVKTSVAPQNNPKLRLTYRLVPPTEKPEIKEPLVLDAVVGQAFSSQIKGTHRPSSYSASTLPSGLSLNTSTGLISGTPTTVGETRIQVGATNAIGTGSAELILRVHESVPVNQLEITAGNSQVGLVGSPLPQVLEVRALNNGTPISGVLVVFDVPEGKGWIVDTSVSPSADRGSRGVVTNAQGKASILLRLPMAPGLSQIQATVTGAAPVSFLETAVVQLPDSINADSQVQLKLLAGAGQSGPSGQVLPQQVMIQALNPLGTPLPGKTLQAEVWSGSGNITPATSTTDAQGRIALSVTPQGSAGSSSSFRVTDTTSGSAIIFSVGVQSASNSGGSSAGGTRTASLDTSAELLAAGYLSVTPFYDEDNNSTNPYDPTKAVLTWSGATGNPTGFLLERKIEGHDWQTILTTGFSTSDYTDDDLKANRRYQYRLYALRGDEKSAPAYVYYRVPVVKSMDFRSSHAFGGKGNWRQFTDSETPKYYRSYTTSANGSGSSSSSNYSSNWSGNYNNTQTYTPVPNPESGGVEWWPHLTYTGSSSYNSSSYSSGENSWSNGGSSSSSNQASNGDWSGSYHDWWSSNNGSGSYSGSLSGPAWYNWYYYGSLVSETATVQTRHYSSGGTNHNTSFTLSNEYTTENLIQDVEAALPEYTDWQNNWYGWGGYDWGYYGWDYYYYGNSYYNYDYYWYGWWASGMDLYENETGYNLTLSQYRLNFYPSFSGDYKWHEVFVPEEVYDLNQQDAAQLYKVHATRTLRPSSQAQSPEYTIDPRDRDEDGNYYIVPVSNLIVTDSSYNVPFDEEQKAKGVDTTNDVNSGAQIILPPTGIPGSTYKLNWTNSSFFKVYAYRSGYDEPEVLSNGQEFTAQQLAEGQYYRFVMVADEDTPPGLNSKLTLKVTQNGTVLNESSAKLIYPDNRDYSMPIDEASGSQYRKIALNGLPMPDSKPQASEESDAEPEETYVDALTLGLRHSTTDVYLPVPGSDLALSSRRDYSPEIWSERSGLRPQEQPDKPFGAAWSSNLTPSVKIVASEDNPKPSEPDKAYVTDESGATHSFYITYSYYNSWGYSSGMQFFPMPTAKNQQTPNLESLEVDNSTSPATLVFKRKFGTTIRYEMTPLVQSISDDRLAGSLTKQKTTYARARTVTDRLGHILDYSYESGNNLIPKTISVRNHPDMKLDVRQNAAGLITSIWDAKGNETKFRYVTRDYSTKPNVGDLWLLDEVETADGAVTKYAYSTLAEEDLTPVPPEQESSQEPHWHCELSSITDPLNQTYSFGYALDHSKKNYKNDVDGTYPGHVGYYIQTGLPRNISTVTMPNGTTAAFQNNSQVWIAYNQSSGKAGVQGQRKSTVTDATGFVRTYTFDQSDVVPVPQVRHSYPDTTNFTEPKMIVYQRMTIRHGNLGSESFEFDLNAAMALKKTTDFSGNSTTFTHADAWSDARATAFKGFLESDATAYGYYGDPTSQTNALGGTKTFTYQGEQRLMKSVTDELGRYTEYDFDAQNLGRRIRERVYTSSAKTTLLKDTEFKYENSLFPGFMTKQIVHKLSGASDPSWVGDLVTESKADSNGRLAEQITDPAGLHLSTKYTYDKNGNKLTATDPRGNTTWFSYDSRNRLITVTYADGSNKQMVYNVRGSKVREYDENGNATLFVYDNLNRLTSQARDMDGSGTVTTGDLVTSFSYNNANAKLTQTDSKGNVTTFVYDGLQRLTSTKTPGIAAAPQGYTTTFEYGLNSGGSAFDSSGFKPTKTTDPRGYTTEVTYDALYRPTQTKAQLNLSPATYAISSTEYDAVGNAKASVDPLGKRSETDYDALNRPSVVRFAVSTPGQVNSSYGYAQSYYTSTGFKWKVQDELGRVSESEFDAAGRPVKATAPEVFDAVSSSQQKPVTQSVYDAAGNVAATINPLGKRWDFVYDVRNRKIGELQPEVFDQISSQAKRPTISSVYDRTGKVVQSTDAKGNTAYSLYDRSNRATHSISPVTTVTLANNTTANLSTVMRMEYDANGNVLKTYRGGIASATTLLNASNPYGVALTETVTTADNTYDALNRLTSSKDAANITVSNEYDAVGNRTAVVDGKSQRTEFSYDGLNRNLTIKDPANKSQTFFYDALNKTDRLDALGVRSHYAYDDRHRLTTVSYFSGASSATDGTAVDTATNATRAYAYDKVGNLQSVTESQKSGKADVAYTYDALNRQITETSGGLQHQYSYDLGGNRLQTIYGGTSRTIISTYDALNRLQTMTEGSNVTSYGYDLNGSVVMLTQPNGDKATTVYNALNRKVSISGDNPANTNNTNLYNYQYLYDLAGNMRRQTEFCSEFSSSVSPGVSTIKNFTYDAINRLTQESDSFAGTTSYTYDNAHNRSTKTYGSTTTTYTYNNLNQLTSTTAGDSYTYDFNGNRLTRSKSGQTDTYGYDFENRLAGLVKQITAPAPNPQTAGTYAYAYDYRTRRVERDETAASGVKTSLIFSGGTSVQEYTVGGASTPVVEYIRGSDYGGGVGGILYTLRSGAASFNHYNARGDVVAKTNASSAITYQSSYEGFGKLNSYWGNTQDRQKANTKDEDPTGLLNEGFRYRDLETGTFITRDPLGFVDGPNMYAYVVQNPWTKFDPDGLKHQVVTGGSRTKRESNNDDAHDKKAENFSKAALKHAAKIAKDGGQVDLYVNKSATDKRSKEDGQDYTQNILDKVADINSKTGGENVKVHFYESARELKDKISANVAAEKADSLQYFGHQTAAGGMWLGFGEADSSVRLPLPAGQFSYAERNPMQTFTPQDVKDAIPTDRVKNSFEFRSYGCNSAGFAQEMAGYFGKPAMGSVGNTDYTPIYMNGSPSPKSAGGYSHYDQNIWTGSGMTTQDRPNDFPADGRSWERGYHP